MSLLQKSPIKELYSAKETWNLKESSNGGHGILYSILTPCMVSYSRERRVSKGLKYSRVSKRLMYYMVSIVWIFSHPTHLRAGERGFGGSGHVASASVRWRRGSSRRAGRSCCCDFAQRSLWTALCLRGHDVGSHAPHFACCAADLNSSLFAPFPFLSPFVCILISIHDMNSHAAHLTCGTADLRFSSLSLFPPFSLSFSVYIHIYIHTWSRLSWSPFYRLKSFDKGLILEVLLPTCVSSSSLSLVSFLSLYIHMYISMRTLMEHIL